MGAKPDCDGALGNVDHKHKTILDRYSAQNFIANAERVRKLKQMNRVLKEDIANLAAKTPDRRKKRYLQRVRRLKESSKQEEDNIQANYLWNIRPDKAYERYSEERRNAWNEALVLNRQELFNRINSSGKDPNKSVIITHERLTHLDESVSGICFHLFGHRHGFKHSYYKGTHYANVSVLDNLLTVYPKGEDIDYENQRNVNAGTYTVIEINSPEKFTVRCEELQYDSANWTVDYWPVTGLPWIPGEEVFEQRK